jgi:hypothetical protein
MNKKNEICNQKDHTLRLLQVYNKARDLNLFSVIFFKLIGLDPDSL